MEKILFIPFHCYFSEKFKFLAFRKYRETYMKTKKLYRQQSFSKFQLVKLRETAISPPDLALFSVRAHVVLMSAIRSMTNFLCIKPAYGKTQTSQN